MHALVAEVGKQCKYMENFFIGVNILNSFHSGKNIQVLQGTLNLNNKHAKCTKLKSPPPCGRGLIELGRVEILVIFHIVVNGPGCEITGFPGFRDTKKWCWKPKIWDWVSDWKPWTTV